MLQALFGHSAFVCISICLPAIEPFKIYNAPTLRHLQKPRASKHPLGCSVRIRAGALALVNICEGAGRTREAGAQRPAERRASRSLASQFFSSHLVCLAHLSRFHLPSSTIISRSHHAFRPTHHALLTCLYVAKYYLIALHTQAAIAQTKPRNRLVPAHPRGSTCSASAPGPRPGLAQPLEL